MPEAEQWKLVPVPYYRTFCRRCGHTERIEGAPEECIEILKGMGWKPRRTGPWCAGCIEDQRRETEKVDKKYSHMTLATQPKYTKIKAVELQLGAEFIYGQSWYSVVEIFPSINNGNIMLKIQGNKTELCILKEQDIVTVNEVRTNERA